MNLIIYMNREDLKKQSIVFVNTPARTCVTAVLICAAWMIMVPAIVITLPASMLMRLLMGLFFTGVIGFLLYGLFHHGWFYLAANDEGWFYECSEQKDSYVFIPWSECLEIRFGAGGENVASLLFKVINPGGLEDVPCPNNGWRIVKTDYIEFGLSGSFNADRVGGKLRRLMRDCNS